MPLKDPARRSDLDASYERLCRCLDEVGEELHAEYLARLVLLLIGEMEDADRILQLMLEAQQASSGD